MWYQKDWFTGSDYYNLKEKQIQLETNDQVLVKRTKIS